jgi:uncharacterized membrane protein YhaH (DUF805 family)
MKTKLVCLVAVAALLLLMSRKARCRKRLHDPGRYGDHQS